LDDDDPLDDDTGMPDTGMPDDDDDDDNADTCIMETEAEGAWLANKKA
jgi:hypothetical protein